MPRLRKSEIEKRIRKLKVGENLWLKCKHPKYENGGILDIYRVDDAIYTVSIWDVWNDRSHWTPHNKRGLLYTGFIGGVFPLVHEWRSYL